MTALDSSSIEVVEAAETDKSILRHLLELYQHDLSEFDGRDVNGHGLYGYRYLDQYWVDVDRRPFLIRVDGQWAGFALVRHSFSGPTEMAEFFVLRRFRRAGVGREAATRIFRMLPGPWRVRQLAGNPSALDFWRRVIPSTFTETSDEDGTMQRFVIANDDEP